MSTNRRDVQLVVRARAEGEKLVEQLTQALLKLGEAENAIGADGARNESKVRGLADAVGALAAVTGKLDTAANQGTAAFDRQVAGLTATQQQLAAVRREIESAQKAIPAAQGNIVDARLAGGDGAKEIAAYQAAQKALAELTAQERKLTNEVRTREAALGQSRSSLQGVASAANAASIELAKIPITAAQIEANADALHQQAAACMAVAAAAREAGSADQQMAEKAARLRAAMDPLSAIQQKLKRDLAELRAEKHRLGLTDQELAQAEAHLSREAKNAADQLERVGRGSRGKIGMFGLKPYELTNLGYQVNDVATGLASGQRPMQIIAQQGGQILQLFPHIGASIVAALQNPAIITAATGLGLVVAAVSRLNNETQRLRDFNSLLHSMGDGAQYSAAHLADAVQQLRHYGVAADDAEKIIRRLVSAGVAPDYLVQFGRDAQNLARVMGVDLDQATQTVTEGLTGNWEAVQRLQQATHFLSQTEEARIRTLFEEGRASEARSEAARIFNQRMEEGANQARGPWERAWTSLKNAWDGLLTSLANSAPIRIIVGLFNGLADALNRVGEFANALSQGNFTTLADAIARGQIEALRRVQQQFVNNPAVRRQLEAQIMELEAQLSDARANERVDPQARGSAGDTVNNAEQQRRRAAALHDIEFQRQILDLQRQYESAITRAARVRIAGEIEYRLALKETNDQQTAEARRQLAQERERNRARLTGEQAIQFAIRRIMAVESGGNPNIRNREGSSATGLGQFVRDTWLSRFKAYFPEQARGLNDRQILQLRTNADISRRMTELYVRENARFLESHGQTVTALNLYFAHYFGAQGAVNFLRAAPGTPIRQALSGGAPPGSRADRGAAAAVASNRELREGRTRQGVYDHVARRFGGDNADNDQELEAQTSVAEELARQAAARAERQTQFNTQLDQELATRQRIADNEKRQQGLSGEELMNEQRRQAIESAVQEVRDRAAQQQLQVSDEQLARTRAVAAAEWDITHAKERATRLVDEATGERTALLEQLRTAMEAGDDQTVAALQRRLRDVDNALASAIGTALRFWRTMNNTPEARQAIATLETLARGIDRTEQDIQRDIAQQGIDRTQALRQQMMTQADFAERSGNMEMARALRQQIRDLDDQLIVAIDRMIAFWQTSDRPEAAAMVAQFQNLRNEVVATHDRFRIFAGDIQQSFANSMTSSIEQWAQAIGEGGNVLRSTWDLARGFAADFIRSLARMLLQALALKAAMKLGFGKVANGLNSMLNVAPMVAAGTVLKSAGSDLTTAGEALAGSSVSWLITAGMIMKAASMLAASGATSAGSGGSGAGPSAALGLLSIFGGMFHGGGIAGSATTGRNIWPGVFAGVARYHVGGLAGLAPGEIPAILKRGEEILTQADPRHIFNGGGMGGGPAIPPKVDLTNVICMDPDELVAKGLSSRVGERVLLSVIRANRGAVKQVLSG